jgi:hypothetical protein
MLLGPVEGRIRHRSGDWDVLPAQDYYLCVKLEQLWRPVITNLKTALIIASGWLLAGLSGLITNVLLGRILLVVIWALYLVCGIPWYITAVVLLRRRYRD